MSGNSSQKRSHPSASHAGQSHSSQSCGAVISEVDQEQNDKVFDEQLLQDLDDGSLRNVAQYVQAKANVLSNMKLETQTQGYHLVPALMNAISQQLCAFLICHLFSNPVIIRSHPR